MCKVGDYILILNNINKNKHPGKYPETQYIKN